MANSLKFGKLYIFEGADGTGKSTIIEHLRKKLKQNDYPVVVFAFPGKKPGSLGNVIYDIHQHPLKYQINKINVASLQLLHIAAHIELIEEEIIPAIKKGKIILLDRYWWSTFVYGKVNGVSTDLLKAMIQIEKIKWRDLSPSAIFYFYCSSPYKQEYSIDFWYKICNEYENLIKIEAKQNKIYKINNISPLEQIVKKIQDLLSM